MNRILSLLVILSAAQTIRAADRDPAALARRVDAHLEARWKQDGITPAAGSDDAEFLRRVHLDLTGRIPTAAEARAFLADPAADKREKLIDRLLAEPGYAAHFARVWCRHWLPQTAAQFEELRPEFEDWLQSQLRANAPYDRMVRALLEATGGPNAGRSAQVFFQANEYKPANLAGNTARLFLGLNLDCAQCHNHPFARWTRDQFWEFAAFFADPTAADGRSLRITPPDSSKELVARFVDGTAPTWAGEPNAAAGRSRLADWVVSPKNPYFAKNAVNRVWAELFGAGLVEPIEDLSGAVVPSHPELFDELATAFADSGFNLRFLLRALMRTKAYQLASAGDGPTPPPQSFARFAVRSMSGDQLFDSLLLAAGLDDDAADRAAFLARFGRPEKPTETGRTILQALTLMNGDTTTAATALTGRGTLAAVAEAPFLDTAGRIEAIYLAVLSRPPSPAEKARLVALVERGGATNDQKRALAAVFWALLNSHEFAVIH